MQRPASSTPADHLSGTATPTRTRPEPGAPMDPERLRRRTWWTTVGVAHGVGAYLLVMIVVTERSIPVAVVAAIGSVCAAVASARLLERHLPGEDMAAGEGGPVPVLLAVIAVAGAIATLAAAQWSDTAMGALAPGVATAGIAVAVPRRLQGATIGAGALAAFATVVAAREVATGQVDRVAAANQVLLVMAVAGGLVVARWFWDLVHRLERARRIEGDLAVADERLRFAADLHDIQGHHLQVIALKSELASRLVESDPVAAATHMQDVHGHAHTALDDTRRVVQGYRRTSLGDELTNATRVLDAAGIEGRMEHGAAGRADGVGEPGRQLLGLVVREATTNILRHSDATRARYRLDLHDQHARLTISNDGASPGTDDDGTGLAALAERLHEAGGAMQWESEGGWFTVTAEVAVGARQPA